MGSEHSVEWLRGAKDELTNLRGFIQDYIGPDDARDEVRRACGNRIKQIDALLAAEAREGGKISAFEGLAKAKQWVENAITNAEYESEYDGQTLTCCHYCDINQDTGQHEHNCKLKDAIETLASISAWEAAQR